MIILALLLFAELVAVIPGMVEEELDGISEIESLAAESLSGSLSDLQLFSHKSLVFAEEGDRAELQALSSASEQLSLASTSLLSEWYKQARGEVTQKRLLKFMKDLEKDQNELQDKENQIKELVDEVIKKNEQRYKKADYSALLKKLRAETVAKTMIPQVSRHELENPQVTADRFRLMYFLQLFKDLEKEKSVLSRQINNLEEAIKSFRDSERVKNIRLKDITKSLKDQVKEVKDARKKMIKKLSDNLTTQEQVNRIVLEAESYKKVFEEDFLKVAKIIPAKLEPKLNVLGGGIRALSHKVIPEKINQQGDVISLSNKKATLAADEKLQQVVEFNSQSSLSEASYQPSPDKKNKSILKKTRK